MTIPGIHGYRHPTRQTTALNPAPVSAQVVIKDAGADLVLVYEEQGNPAKKWRVVLPVHATNA